MTPEIEAAALVDWLTDRAIRHIADSKDVAACRYRLTEAIAAAAAAVRSAEPVAWVIPGDDNANANGFIDAMAYREGEFTRPLYAAAAVRSGPPESVEPAGWKPIETRPPELSNTICETPFDFEDGVAVAYGEDGKASHLVWWTKVSPSLSRETAWMPLPPPHSQEHQTT